MNIENVKRLFTMFSGKEADEVLMPFINLALSEVGGMLKNPSAEDMKLDFLTAAVANLRYQQSESAKIQTESFYEGSLTVQDKNKIIALSFASRMAEDYLNLCHNLVNGSTFVFMGVGSKEVTADAQNNR